MEFYSLKHRRPVTVPDEAVRKRRIRRGPRHGHQGARYAVLAEVTIDGAPATVSRFIKRDAFHALDVPEVRLTEQRVAPARRRPHQISNQMYPVRRHPLVVKKLYFGNLSWNTADADLNHLVSQYAEVISARVATDRETGRSRGFGFVEVPEAAADAVITALNGTQFDGRALTVNEARPREDRPRANGNHRSDRSYSGGYDSSVRGRGRY